MANAKKIGEYEGTFLYRESNGSVWASGLDEGPELNPDLSRKVTCLVDAEEDETVEGFIDALRTATADPFCVLLDALGKFIGDDTRDHGTDEYRRVMAAYDALLADIEKDADEDGEE